MAAGYPSGTNTFVPSHEASGSLVVGFSRNPDKFRINKYTKLIPIKKDVFYYLRLTAEEAARVINTNGADFVWPDGEEAPDAHGNTNVESFEFVKAATKRYAFPFTLGDKAVDQASWEILAAHSGISAQKEMTFRTQLLWNVLSTTGNWSGNTDTATNLGGGQLDVATTTNLYIKKTWRAVCEVILKATLGVVQREDLVAVLNPHTAGLLAESQELVQHLIQSPFAMAQVRGDVPSQNGNWGLPDELYGVKIVVEDAVKVTSKKLATKATTYVCPAQTIVFLARPGGLVGMEGIPEFSTAQGFFYEEATVEVRHDVNNRRQEGRVVSDFTYELVAPASGFLVTAATQT